MTEIVRGLDISGYTSVTSWTQPWKEGVRFIIIKASEGRRTTSRVFPSQWANAEGHGYLCGTYHFARPYNRAESEAEWYVTQLRKVGWRARYDLPPVLDIEDSANLSKSALTAWCLKFLTHVDSLLKLKEPWLKCGVYCNTNFYTNHIDGAKVLDGRWLWHAKWPAKQKEWPTNANSMSFSAAIWQWKGDTIIPGASPVDFNIARLTDLKRLAPLFYEGDDVSLTTDEIQAIAKAVLNAPLIDMTDVAKEYGYTKVPPVYSLRQLVSDASWRTRAGNEAFKAFAAEIDEVAGDAVRAALEKGVLDVNIQFSDRTDTETTPQ